MVSKSYIDAFIPAGKDDKVCINCGICLQKCPVMKMDKTESKEEMKRLLNGEETKRVLNECTFCFSCNHYCPQGLKPYALILERMTAKNRQSGKTIPASIEYMFTGQKKSDYFSDLYNAAPAEDKAVLEKWSKVPAKSKDTLFVGCAGRTMPQGIEYSAALSNLPKFAPRDACCGEIPYRFGDYQAFTEIAERTKKHLESLNTERLVCYCGSCANYFGNIWPNYHGVKLPFEVISLWEWLWEKYQTGQLSVKRPSSAKVAITDSCYSSELGDKFYEAVRGLHQAAGMNIVELQNNRYDSLCCGFASGVRNGYDQTQVEIETKKKVKQIIDAGANEVSCYCPGCWMSIGRLAPENNLKVHFAINKILKALGDNPPTAK